MRSRFLSIANVSERSLLRLRALLASLWGLLLVSLLVNPLELVGAAWDVRLFWTLIAAAPCLILVVGHEGWRRICPLSFLSQIPRYLGLQRQALLPKDSWIARNHLFVQFGLLAVGVFARAVFMNSDRVLLGVALLGVISAAVFTGWRYAGKPWCQYFCPIAPVQKFFSAPAGLLDSAPHRAPTPIPKSMCRNVQKDGPDERACVGCRSDCADIDLEHNHWRELFKPGQSLVYYGYPGLLSGFYAYHAWRTGGVQPVLDGAWVARSTWSGTTWTDWGWALLIFGTAMAACVWGLGQVERAWARWRKRAGCSFEQARHEMFSVCVLLSLLVFYYFGQAAFKWLIPVDYRALGFAMVAGAGFLWAQRSLQRAPAHYQQEVLAQRLKRNLARLFDAGSEPLRRVLGNRHPMELQDREVYWVGRTLHAFSAENSVTLYQTLLKPLLHPAPPAAVPSDAELLTRLASIRSDLGVSEEDHHIVLNRLREGQGAQGTEHIPLEDTLRTALLDRVRAHYPQLSTTQEHHVLQVLNMTPAADGDSAPVPVAGMALDLSIGDGRKTLKYRAHVVRNNGSDIWVDVNEQDDVPPFKAGAMVSGYFVDAAQACAYRFLSRLKRKHLDLPRRLLLQAPGTLARAERRQSVRAAFSFKGTLTPLAQDGLEDPSLVAEMVDLGAGGALFYLDAHYVCQDRQAVQLDFTLPDGKQISCAACVVRAGVLQLADQRRVQQVAIAFADMHDADHAVVSRAVFRELSRLLLECGQLAPGGWRKARLFQVARVVDEGGGVRSFYLAPWDRRPLPSFKPGQFLTFQLGIGTRSQVIRRCYSLSDAPRPDYFRVSIKRVLAPADQPALPPGLSSNFFHQRVHQGALLEVMQPAGGFFLDAQDPRPVVLVGGGIGITPVLSMLNQLVQDDCVQPIIHFFLGVRNGSEHIFKAHLQAVAQRCPKLQLVVCYSAPTAKDQIGHDYHHEGRVTAELIAARVGQLDCHFYLCGPSAFMRSISEGLVRGGAAQADVRFEAFGPASVGDAKLSDLKVKTDAKIHFSNADQVFPWSDKVRTVLELAEHHGLVLPYGCRAGNCHACAIEIKAGEVAYLKKAEPPPEPGQCLTCIAVPQSDLTLVDPA